MRLLKGNTRKLVRKPVMPGIVHKTVTSTANAARVGYDAARKIVGSEVGNGVLALSSKVAAGTALVGGGVWLAGKGAIPTLKDVGILDRTPEEVVDGELAARTKVRNYVDSFYDSNGLPAAQDPRALLAEKLYNDLAKPPQETSIPWGKIALALVGIGTAVGGVILAKGAR